MRTQALIVTGALVALGYYLWQRQQDALVQKPAAQVVSGTTAARYKMTSEDWG